MKQASCYAARARVDAREMKTQAAAHQRNVSVDELDGGAQLYEREVNE